MIWKVNTVTSLKVISDTPDFKLSYMKDTDNQFTEITGFISMGDLLYIGNHSFDTIGSYIIKLSDNNTNLVRYETINVVDESFNYMLTNTKYSSSYDGAYLVFEKE